MPSTLRLGSLVFTIIAFPVLSLAGEPAAVPAANAQVVVAAGFGFQDEEVSFITVKTYDGNPGKCFPRTPTNSTSRTMAPLPAIPARGSSPEVSGRGPAVFRNLPFGSTMHRTDVFSGKVV